MQFSYSKSDALSIRPLYHDASSKAVERQCSSQLLPKVRFTSINQTVQFAIQKLDDDKR
jgi:hypothetical protein